MEVGFFAVEGEFGGGELGLGGEDGLFGSQDGILEGAGGEEGGEDGAWGGEVGWCWFEGGVGGLYCEELLEFLAGVV